MRMVQAMRITMKLAMLVSMMKPRKQKSRQSVEVRMELSHASAVQGCFE